MGALDEDARVFSFSNGPDIAVSGNSTLYHECPWESLYSS